MNPEQPDDLHKALSQQEPPIPQENKTVQMEPITPDQVIPFGDTTQMENGKTQEMGNGTVLIDKRFGEPFKADGQPVTDEDSNALAIAMNQVNEQIEHGIIKPEDADQIRIDTAKRFGFDWKPKSNE